MALAFLMLGFVEHVTAQPTHSFGARDSIYSKVLNQERQVQIIMPDDYKPGDTTRYDVIYVTDGGSNARPVSDVDYFLHSEGYAPETIVVGIMNIDRDKDLTTTHVSRPASSGGAHDFLRFITDELVPYINAHYPTNGDNALFGHSYGGLFVIDALLTKPDAFLSYIAADPSLWWDGRYENHKLARELAALPGGQKTLSISGRTDALGQMGIDVIDTLFKNHAPANLLWKLTSYPEETHGTMRLKAIDDGLKFTYKGYNMKTANVLPTKGIVVPGQPFYIWFVDWDTSGVRYTIDGTLPTRASSPISRSITMPGPGSLHARRFTNRSRYDVIVSSEFKSGAPLTPPKEEIGLKPGGLNYAYYEGRWDKLPDFAKLNPVRSGIADSSFRFDSLPETNFGLVLEGQLNITEPGYYVFALQSDDGARFYFNHELQLDNDGIHDETTVKSVLLPLKKGFYPIRVEYFQKGGAKVLSLKYISPERIDITYHLPLEIPLSMEYHK